MSLNIATINVAPGSQSASHLDEWLLHTLLHLLLVELNVGFGSGGLHSKEKRRERLVPFVWI